MMQNLHREVPARFRISKECGFDRLPKSTMHVKNTRTGLVALNKSILKDPLGAARNELVSLLELEDPQLSFLCPLARAIFFAETGRLTKASSGEALATVWCIDDTFATDTSETGEYAQVIEEVCHEIVVRVGRKPVTLGFRSTTNMTHYTAFWPDYVRSVAADQFKPDERCAYSWFLEEVFSLLDQGARRGSPQGYPSDSGEFIGASSYKLVSVGGLPVDGPTFKDNYHEQCWQGLSDVYGQQLIETEEDELGGFCWLHYLSRSQAEQLELTASGDEAIGPDQGHPEWTPRYILEENLLARWVSTDMIYKSYSKGKVQVQLSQSAYIAIGCGTDWEPSSNPDDQEELDEEMEFSEYPKEAGPLFKIEINRESDKCPDALATLLFYLKQFYNELAN